MYQFGILQGFRCLSKNQQQIIRHIQIAVRPTLHNNGNIRQGHLLREIRRSFLNVHAKKVLPCCAVRWYKPLPDQSKDGELIYRGSLAKAVLGVKLLSYSSSMFTLCVMPFILKKAGVDLNSMAQLLTFCGIGLFTFVIPFLLHMLTKGYIVRLYHNTETDMYTAITYSAVLVEKRTVFHQSDVVIPDVSRMFTSFYAKKRSMLVNPELFSLPHAYNHLMGYDRPFSFDTDDLNKPDKS
ncbi:transmembrane protein 70, mitochondrial [Puntigrus tetrazona]|uniref:transmembrane protein 70, mitochondrial n=1 Tax=Puntigrus tetrazona TaxID=1606681 RepID=UPI001C88FA73|nr:transmembrane protein 70, mitochondrial [Puntigrus tetrazona]